MIILRMISESPMNTGVEREMFGVREGRFPQNLGGAGEQVELTVRMNIDTGTIALQAAIEEDVELTEVIEDDLTRDGQVPGEQDLIDS